MRIYCPADAADAAAVLACCLPPTVPTYVRLTARQDPRVFAAGEDREVHGVRVLRDGLGVLVLATGRCVGEALAAAEGTDACIGAVTCLAPFPAADVRALARGRAGIVTVAEALAVGGLGERTSVALGPAVLPRVDLYVDDRYPPVLSHEVLLAHYRVDRKAIRSAIDRLSGGNSR
jgi:transketolase